MAIRIGALTIDFRASTAGFSRDMGKAERAVRSGSTRMNRSLGKLDRGLLKVEKSFGRSIKSMFGFRAVLGAVAGTAGIGLLVKRSIEAADKIGKTADKIGFTTGQLQELRFAAAQSGVEVRTLDLALQRFSRRTGEAAQNSGELLGTAKAYNVQLRDGEGRMRSNIDLFGDFAEVIANAESEQEELRVSFKLFDSEGAALVNLLRKGRDGFAAYAAQARALGIVIDEDLIRGSEGAADKLNILATVLSARVTVAVAENADKIAELATNLTSLVPPAVRAATAVVKPFADMLRDISGDSSAFAKTLAVIMRVSPSGLALAAAGALGLPGGNATAGQIDELTSGRSGSPTRTLGGRGTRRPAAPVADPSPASIAGSGRLRPTPRPAISATTRPANLELEKALARNKDIIAALEKERAALDQGARALAINAAARRLNKDATAEQTTAVKRLAGGLFDTRKAQAEATAQTTLAKQVFDETRTPAEAYKIQIGELNTLLDAGAIGHDTYARKVEQVQEALNDTRPIVATLENGIADLAGSMITFGQDSENALENLKNTMQRVGESIVSELLRVQIRALAARAALALTNSFSSTASVGAGGGFGTPGASAAGAGTPFAHGGSFTVGGRGGTDANLVPLRLTRGERVDVTEAGKVDRRGKGAGLTVSQTLNINIHPDVSVVARQQILEMMPTITEAAKIGVQSAAARDPSFLARGAG